MGPSKLSRAFSLEVSGRSCLSVPTVITMALTNAEKQKRREGRYETTAVLDTGSTSNEIAEMIFRELGPARARGVIKHLTARLRNLKADCPVCGGTGYTIPKLQVTSVSGANVYGFATMPCYCPGLGDRWRTGAG
jgi:hypothetical protein